MTETAAGFREIEHTADWELEAWGPNLAALFEQAARGMYQLCGAKIAPEPHLLRELDLHAQDWESLLVLFLSELLFLGESERIGFDHFELILGECGLCGRLAGGKLTNLAKEIKAVTYNNLKIVETQNGYSVRVVFDV